MTKILVIEDSLFQQDLLKKELAKGAYTDFLTATNAAEGIKLCITEHPDIVTMDINMKPKSEPADVKSLKKGYPGVKVIMLSVINQPEVKKKFLAAGADVFLTKPIDTRELLTTIKRLEKKR
jgi:two-component system, OmpR family, response regulator MprA